MDDVSLELAFALESDPPDLLDATRFRTATERAAVFVSDAGLLKLTGADARDLLNRLSTNLVDPDAPPGSVCATVLTSDRGRIVDLVYVIHCDDHQLLLTSPGRQDAVAAFLDQYTIMEDLEVADITASTTMLTLAGPAVLDVLRAVMDGGCSTLSPLPSAFLDAAQAGVARSVGISEPRSGEREWGAFLILPPFNPDAAALPPACHLLYQGEHAHAAVSHIITHLLLAGAAPLSAAAAETLRIARRQPRYGAEMSDAYNPLEAGLIGAVDFHKGCYIGQEVIARLDTYHKVQKYLVALRFESDDGAVGAPPAPGSRLLDPAGKPAGLITSATAIPLDANADANADDGSASAVVGLGYVRTASAQVGSRLQVAPPDGSDPNSSAAQPKITAAITALPQLFGGEQPAPPR